MDAVILSLSAGINLLLGAVVFFHNRRPLINKVFLAAIVFVVLASYCNYRIDTSTIPEASLAWLKLFVFFGYCFIYLFFLFGLLFPEPRREALLHPGHILIFLYVFFVAPALIFSDLAFRAVTLGPKGLEAIEFGPWYLPLFVGMLALMAVHTVLLILKRRGLAPAHRAQIRLILTGWLLFLFLIVLFGGVIPFFLPMFVNASKIVPLFSVIMAGFTAYAIARHEFLDIRVIIQRGLIYATLLAMTVMLYLTLVGTAVHFFHRITDTTVIVSGLITALAGIFGAPRIERAFRRATDRFFFKEKYDYSEALQRLSDLLHSHIESDEIVARTGEELRAVLRASHAKVLLGPASAPADSLEIPIVLQEEVLGRIALGPKLSGDPFSEEDRRLLRTFSSQLAIALGRAKLYEKVRQYSRELEDRVRERTGEIKKLQEDQRQMMVEISHNLQSPLTIVKGELGGLKEQLPANEHLATFERSIDRVSRFIYDLLKLARLETDRVEPVADPLDLALTIEELSESFEVLAADQGITFRRELTPKLFACIPRNKLEELIMNLVGNAFTYRSPGLPHEVEVRLFRNGNDAEISVRDTGLGIRSEEKERIFNRFYRANENSVSKGTGLGLAICKRIAENYGGTITVQSEFGKGSTFTVRLPLDRADQK